jgi:hypothetical protein
VALAEEDAGAAAGNQRIQLQRRSCSRGWAYVAGNGDRKAFQRWMDWIWRADLPRYCPNDKCYFKFGDCPLLDRLGVMEGVGVKPCDPAAYVRRLIRLPRFQDQFNESVGAIMLVPGSTVLKPEIKLLRDPFDLAMKKLDELQAEIDKLQELAATYVRVARDAVPPTSFTDEIVQTITTAHVAGTATVSTVNTFVNGDDYRVHNAAMEVYLLMWYGALLPGEDQELKIGAEHLVGRGRDNAFYEFLAHRNSDQMLALILKDCPAAPKPGVMDHAKFEWIWQRDDPLLKSAKTMYWDCLFVARLYLKNPAPSPKSLDLGLASGVDLKLKAAQATYDLTVGQIEGILKQLKDLEDLAKGKTNPVAFIKQQLQTQLAPLRKTADSLKSGVSDVQKGDFGAGAKHLMEAASTPPLHVPGPHDVSLKYPLGKWK